MIFVISKLFASKFIRVMQKLTASELFVLVIIGFAFGLGETAFLAGSLLSQSSISKQIEHLMEPFRDIFSAIYFATIGMMIDPVAMLSNIRQIIIISLIALFAKSAAC
jgi:CPA2 family monovalent cation:H+ antiporter-2